MATSTDRGAGEVIESVLDSPSLHTGMHPEIDAQGDDSQRTGKHPQRGGDSLPALKEITRAWIVELDPTYAQARRLLRYCGTARFVWNTGLAKVRDDYEGYQTLRRGFLAITDGRFEPSPEAHRRMSAYDLQHWFVLLKDKPETAWLRESPAKLIEGVCSDLDMAFKHFFRRVRNGEVPGYPKFKSRDRAIPAFRVRGTRVDTNGIRVPKLGYVRAKERGYLKEGKPKSVTVKYYAGKWWAAVCDFDEVAVLAASRGSLIVDTTGETITYKNGTIQGSMSKPNPYRRELRRLRIRQRRVSRRSIESKRRAKAVLALQKLHARIAWRRRYLIHRQTTELVRQADHITVIRRKVLLEKSGNPDAADAAVGEFCRQLKYKLDWYGGTYEERVVE